LRTFATDNGDTGTDERLRNGGNHALLLGKSLERCAAQRRVGAVSGWFWGNAWKHLKSED